MSAKSPSNAKLRASSNTSATRIRPRRMTLMPRRVRVIVGPVGSGKTSLAREMAESYRTKVEISAEQFRSPSACGSALATAPELVIVDGISASELTSGGMKAMLWSPTFRCERKHRVPVEVPTPAFIFCVTADSLEGIPNDRRFAATLLKAPARPAPKPEMVAHPEHYNRGGIECMQVSAAMVTGWTPQAAYRLGQAHDYIFRHAHKGQAIQDLEKAVFWIQEHIRALKAEATEGVFS